MPSLIALLLAGYSVALLVVAWVFDGLGKKSSARSASWRTGNFVYHEDRDAWKCHQDEWLWPASFDPDKRVIRYQGQHAICGRCPAKTECSPTPGPREITKAVDPWPHSEAGRFHRGIALVLAVIAVFLPAGMLLADHAVPDVVVLVATLAVVTILGVVPLGKHLAGSPDNFPTHLVHEASSDHVDTPRTREPVPLDLVIDRYATRWTGDRPRVDPAVVDGAVADPAVADPAVADPAARGSVVDPEGTSRSPGRSRGPGRPRTYSRK
ncbi:hypothetical protein MM440_12925 [Arsenicicoccus piscis]|uniref:Transposase DDE domain-containing protein n=1 Tax=Arsenicicoccus piscis TaxID=673954 RepID=A0ABQ6HLZ8_9MICO|nr:hypothetical protein [Arsenicicoccus piscis]MCH8628638.1 hypothetical protein [Arsenicicoccus piscis]GMA19431.1 hypothetical protein GCM10025862_14520 [Arsenicicoccus piscis]